MQDLINNLVIFSFLLIEFFILLFSNYDQIIMRIKNNGWEYEPRTKKRKIQKIRESELTNHTAKEEYGLDQPNLKLVPANQTPIRNGGGAAAADPLPRVRWEAADACPGGAGRAGNAGPVRFTVGENHDHGVEGLEGPGEAGEYEVLQLPLSELPAVFLQHLIDAHLLRRPLLLRLRRRRQHRRPQVIGIRGQCGRHFLWVGWVLSLSVWE